MTLGLVSSNVASVFGQRWVSDAVASAPMVIMLVVRSCELYSCAEQPFIASDQCVRELHVDSGLQL